MAYSFKSMEDVHLACGKLEDAWEDVMRAMVEFNEGFDDELYEKLNTIAPTLCSMCDLAHKKYWNMVKELK